MTSAKEGGYWSYYEYDAIDQLTEEEKPGLSYLANYTYDANGNRLTRTVNSVTETYAYDEADKLETVTVISCGALSANSSRMRCWRSLVE